MDGASFQYFEYKSRPRYAHFALETLTLTMRKGMTFRMHTTYRFAFTVINPELGQDAPNVTISGKGTATFLPSVMTHHCDIDSSCDFLNGNAAALVIADFTEAFISQSTPSQGFINTISITTATRVVLLPLDNSRPVASERPASTVIVSGLRGSATPGCLAEFRAVDLDGYASLCC